MSVFTFNLGERARIEAVDRMPQVSMSPVLLLAEDRYRLMNPDRELRVPQESPAVVMHQAAEELWDLGEVVPHRFRDQMVLDVIVYDLDTAPIITLMAVEEGLMNVMDLLQSRQMMEIAMEPIGMAHNGISSEEFATILKKVLSRGPIGLRVELCDPDPTVLLEIHEAMQKS